LWRVLPSTTSSSCFRTNFLHLLQRAVITLSLDKSPLRDPNYSTYNPIILYGICQVVMFTTII
jgi:hypothetical protein